MDYRDTIQFLWDQTVRAINRGVDPDVLSHEIVLPPRLARSPYARQHYGLVRHHVRQIHGGVLGWWGNDGAELMAHHPAEEARRIIRGFGGRDEVLTQLQAALDNGDAPWAARLGSWLLRADPDDGDAGRGKAAALRLIGQTTTSANVRAFTLTEARELEGLTDRTALTRPMVSRHQVRTMPPETFLRAMRVQLDPERSAELYRRLVVQLGHAEPMALHVRGGVAAFESPPRGEPDLLLRLDLDAWADLICGKQPVTALLGSGRAELTIGTPDQLTEFFAAFPDALVRTGE
jgi:alkyl sulfatase BDS1-like metallo-beta-lactamase superfamily hydrolase